LIGVVEHHAVYAPEHVLKTKVELRVAFQPSLKVSSQVCLSDYLAIGRPQQLGGNWLSQLDRIVIMHHDQIQIMTIPSGNPMVGQIPSFVFCHFISPLERSLIMVEKLFPGVVRLNAPACHQIDSEAAQPMSAFVVRAGYC